MFFLLFIDVRVVSREVNMYDFPSRTINGWDKVLRGKTTMSVVVEIGLATYQRVSIKVLMFGIPSET